jgi:hypothetical protein
LGSRKAGSLPLTPFTKDYLPLANSALEIILKGINRVNYKKAVIIALAIVGKIPSVVLIKLMDKNFFSKKGSSANSCLHSCAFLRKQEGG